ncbi:MAG: hypothetical protein B7Y77_01655 [Bradyrhizobium sp. 35-63-5]|nr:MAG: hypothetical protein B7Y77_01655 [Bradyrhizobium sp. 35-63-5]
MVAYNFNAQFADAVEAGRKHQTIRAMGKRRHARAGEQLQLYTGMRTKACRKLRDAVCHDACSIQIERDAFWTFKPQELHTGETLERFARADGFASWPEMRDWFDRTHGLPLVGVMIRWLVPK